MSDPIREGFLVSVEEDAALANRESDVLRLVGVPREAGSPDTWHGLLRGVEHLVRAGAGPVGVSHDPIPFTLTFPSDYLSSVDPTLQLRVASVHPHARLFHSNVSRFGQVCLGAQFAPGTRLRPLVEQLYDVCSFRITATEDSFNADAAIWIVEHVEQVRALRAAPLWRRALASAVRVETLRAADEGP